MLEIKNLSQSYGKQKVLDDFCMSIAPGTVFGLLGENGVGKTTLMNLIMGFIHIYEGEILVFDSDIRTKGNQCRSKMGYVSTDLNLYPDLTLKQNLDFFSSFYPEWNWEICLKLQEQLNIPGNQKISTFSKGMKKKAQLILTLSHQPQFLLMDEPSAGLDPVIKKEFMSEIINLLSNQGNSILYATNNPNEIEFLAENIGILLNGKLIISESMEVLKHRFRKLHILAKNYPFPETLNPSLLRKIDDSTYILHQYSDEIESFLSSAPPNTLLLEDLSLEEIYIQVYHAHREGFYLKEEKTDVNNNQSR